MRKILVAVVLVLAACSGQTSDVEPQAEPVVVDDTLAPMTVFPPVEAGEAWCVDRGYEVVDGAEHGRAFVCVDDGLPGG